MLLRATRMRSFVLCLCMLSITVCVLLNIARNTLYLYVVGGCNVEMSVIHRKCAWFMSFTVNGNKIGFETTKLSSDTFPLLPMKKKQLTLLENNAIEPLSATFQALLWYFKRFYMKTHILVWNTIETMAFFENNNNFALMCWKIRGNRMETPQIQPIHTIFSSLFCANLLRV